MTRPDSPGLSADILIRPEGRGDRLVLIKRGQPPFGLALPGGFVDIGERVEDAARREAFEETGLTVSLRALLGVYSDPGRDPRGHTVSVVYVADASGTPRAGDDAAAARIADPGQDDLRLAFDHDRILDDYRRWLATGRSPDPG